MVLGNKTKIAKADSISDEQKTLLSAGTSIINRFVQMASFALLAIILVKGLEPGEYGAYKMISSIMVAAAVLTSMSLDRIFVRYIPELKAKQKWGAINRLVFIGLGIRCGLILAFFLITNFILKESFFGFFNLPKLLYIFYGFICFIISMQLVHALLSQGLFTAYIKQYLASAIEMVGAVIRVISFVTVLYLGWGLKGLIICMAIIELVLLLIYLALTLQILRQNQKRQKMSNVPPVLEFGRIARFGLARTMGQWLALSKREAMDFFVIQKFYSVTEVALYGLATTFAMFFSQLALPNLLTPVLSPIVIKRYIESDKNPQVLDYSFGLLNRINLFISVPMLIGILTLVDRAIIVIAREGHEAFYAGAIPSIVVLVSFYFIRSFVYPCSFVARILERNIISLVVSSLSIYNLTMDIILVKKIGIIGAAIATGSTGLLSYIVSITMLKWKYQGSLAFPWQSLRKIITNSIPMFIFLLVTRRLINDIPSLVTIVLLGSILYFIASYFNKVFLERDRELVNKEIGKKLMVF